MKFISRIIDYITTPYTVYLLIKDTEIPRGSKIKAVIGLAVIFAYIVSPFDIVPDYVPLSGWVDDLVVVPLGMALVRWLTPDVKIVETKNRAQRDVKKALLLTALTLAGIILLGLAWAGLLIYFIIRLFTG